MVSVRGEPVYWRTGLGAILLPVHKAGDVIFVMGKQKNTRQGAAGKQEGEPRYFIKSFSVK